MGCSRATRAQVDHGERFISAKRSSSPAMKKTAPKILSRAIVYALRWKICDIGREVDQGVAGTDTESAANTRPRDTGDAPPNDRPNELTFFLRVSTAGETVARFASQMGFRVPLRNHAIAAAIRGHDRQGGRPFRRPAYSCSDVFTSVLSPPGAFSGVNGRFVAYFSNHAISVFSLKS